MEKKREGVHAWIGDLWPMQKSASRAQENVSKNRPSLPTWLTTDLQIGQINGPHPLLFSIDWEQLLEYWDYDRLLPNLLINLIEFQHELDDDDVLTIDDLDLVPTEMEDSHLEV